jgi:hypothetical protein
MFGFGRQVLLIVLPDAQQVLQNPSCHKALSVVRLTDKDGSIHVDSSHTQHLDQLPEETPGLRERDHLISILPAKVSVSQALWIESHTRGKS